MKGRLKECGVSELKYSCGVVTSIKDKFLIQLEKLTEEENNAVNEYDQKAHRLDGKKKELMRTLRGMISKFAKAEIELKAIIQSVS